MTILTTKKTSKLKKKNLNYFKWLRTTPDENMSFRAYMSKETAGRERHTKNLKLITPLFSVEGSKLKYPLVHERYSNPRP